MNNKGKAANRINYVNKYIDTKANLLKAFGFTEEIFIKPMLKHNWSIETEDDLSVLSYWTDEKEKSDCVAVRRGDGVYMKRLSEYTAVVAIECVKVAFIFSNNLKIR